jgi:DNA polymerase III gamma/tau subunit
VLRPGAAGFIAEQVRDIIRDVNLSPVEGRRKVYVLLTPTSSTTRQPRVLKTLEGRPMTS